MICSVAHVENPEDTKIRIGIGFSAVCFVTAEIIAYLVLFHHVYMHNNCNMKQLLSIETRNHRNKTNTISLAGQLYAFLTEMSLIIVLIFHTFITSSSEYFQLSMELVAFAMSIQFGILALVQVLTSPDLRQELQTS